MENLRILVVEDDPLQAAELCNILADAGYLIAGKAHSGERALQIFQEKSPDLVLLDIGLQLGTGQMDGIETAQHMALSGSAPIIYLTGNPDHFERAKTTSPAQFFEKPYNARDLLRAIDLAIHNHAVLVRPDEKERGAEQKPAPFSNVLFSKESNCLWIKTKAGEPFFKLSVSDILFIKAANVYMEIYTAHKAVPHVVTLGLGAFAAQSPFADLVQTHRSYMVNVKAVTGFDSHKLSLAGGHSVSVSEAYLGAVREALAR
jgi:two-component system, response regulator PdtaR